MLNPAINIIKLRIVTSTNSPAVLFLLGYTTQPFRFNDVNFRVPAVSVTLFLPVLRDSSSDTLPSYSLATMHPMAQDNDDRQREERRASRRSRKVKLKISMRRLGRRVRRRGRGER